MTETAAALAPGLALVARRQLIAGPIEAWFPLSPGDRPFVGPGQAVVRGAPMADRLREPRTVVVPGPVTDKLRRNVPMGWYWLGAYGVFRQASLRGVESASSIGANS